MTPQVDSTYLAATTQAVAQGSTSILMVAFFRNSLQLAMPFIVPALLLICVDLVFGCMAAKRRGEEVRTSRAIRRTVDKIVSYTCWVILSASLAVAFDFPLLNKIILGIVMFVELLSVITNYFCMRGKKITGLWEAMLRIVGKKVDADLSGVKIEDYDTNDRTDLPKGGVHNR